MLKVFLILVVSLISFSSYGATDAATRDLLINKFRKVRSGLAPSDKARVQVSLRLADLLAEQARHKAMDEINSGCMSNCNAGVTERNESLKYYKENLKQIPEIRRGRVLTQMGHLFELNGEQAKALKLYQNVVRTEKNPAFVAEAQFSLGEIFFKKRNFPQALKHYTKALSRNEFTRKGLGTYRQAWCYFNSGQISKATAHLEKILGSPALLTRSGNGAGIISVDRQFQEEVSRDLAVFYAKRPATLADAKKLYKLSPESAKLNNIDYFAGELERMGQNKTSIAVWTFANAKQADPKKRLESHIRLANLKLQTKQQESSLENYTEALSLWSQMGKCEGVSCSEWKTRLRKYVLDWNRLEKKKPSENLYSAYKKYLNVFKAELDMKVWAAQVADSLSHWKDSVALYKAAAVSSQSLSVKELQAQKIPSAEKLLILVMEVAEKSKDQSLMRQSYNDYLKTSLEKTKVVEVKYQLANMLYNEKKYAEASVALKEVAILPLNQAPQIKTQAADLALDSLVILKKDAELETWASEFARQFPAKRSEYLAISQKSILNQSAQLVAGAGAAAGSATAAWAALMKIKPAESSDAVKKTYYKNKMLLAEKLQKWAEVKSSSEKLLSLKAISADDKELALSKLAWIAELRLDFRTALSTTKKMQLKSLSPDKKALKLAMFAELSGGKPEAFYSNFLKTSRDKAQNLAVVTKLVHSSNKPFSTLAKYKKFLSGNPELMTQLYYEKAVELNNFKAAQSLIKNKKLLNTAGGKSIWRYGFMAKVEKAASKIFKMNVDSSNQRKLSRSIKLRGKALNSFEGLVKSSIDQGDWTGQVVSIKILADESERFYQELMSLPMPEGLSSEEQQQYMQILSQQASPYHLKAQDLKAKHSEFWNKPNLQAEFEKSLRGTTGDLRKRIQWEIAKVAQVAPQALSPSLKALSESPVQAKAEIPSLSLLEGARDKVRAAPMNVQFLTELKRLEEKTGNETMSAYLQGRIEKSQL